MLAAAYGFQDLFAGRESDEALAVAADLAETLIMIRAKIRSGT